MHSLFLPLLEITSFFLKILGISELQRSLNIKVFCFFLNVFVVVVLSSLARKFITIDLHFAVSCKCVTSCNYRVCFVLKINNLSVTK